MPRPITQDRLDLWKVEHTRRQTRRLTQGRGPHPARKSKEKK
jgi:hypothetical protein